VSVEIDADVVRQVEARLDARRDALAGFFGIGLSDREGAGFLRYRPGGFYAPHRDRADVASWPGAARRAIAVIAFVNGSRDVEARGEFRGGVLRLFVEGEAIDVHPRQGQLVAFRADTLHEVTEVIGGTRDVIVDWFYGA
jgi:SM-20-related protein